MNKLIAVIVVITAICAAIFITSKESERPHLDLRKWWGDGKLPVTEDNSIRPFKIDFNDTMIEDLKQRLQNRRRFTKTLEGMQSWYGINSEFFQEKLSYWVNKYNFKKRAELLNMFPHYKTRIQGLDLHFIRVKPKVKANIKVLPLLMVHGWPSSSKEFTRVIPMLTTPREGYQFIFEVIAVDLPGFGFSEGTNKPGLNPVQMAIMLRNLMLRLGIEKFYIQAGDWGSQCATHLSTLFPDNVLGFHTNMPFSSRPISMTKFFIGSLFPSLIDSGRPGRVYPLRKFMSYILRESGYFHIQATKPDTIGCALSDSPAGLAAYIMEKMAVCSNKDELNTPHGGLNHLDIDDVLDTITISWMNECIVTSMRIYAEGLSSQEIFAVHKLHLKMFCAMNVYIATKCCCITSTINRTSKCVQIFLRRDAFRSASGFSIATKVPTAAIKFLHEVLYQPDWLLKDKFYNLVRSTIVDHGGHFAALHTPNELVDDIFEATVEFLKFHSSNKMET